MQPNQENKVEQKNDQQVSLVNSQEINKKPQESSPDIKSEENKANWESFRKKREEERKAKEEAEKRATEKAAEAEALKAALEALTNKPNNRQINESYSGDGEETEEQRISRIVDSEIKKREVVYDAERKKREQMEFPDRLNSIYPDFNQVCSTENLDYLQYHHPILAKSLGNQPDGFDKWNDIYRAIKTYIPNPVSKQEMAKVEKNLSKPGSISSIGTSQGQQGIPPPKLDEARMKANWERMQKTLKGLS